MDSDIEMDLDVAVEPSAEFDARLDTDGVGFTDRDAELLRAIDERNSINGAASALGRSYSHSQRRIVELEDAFGTLVERQRGGEHGGGSRLTDTARDLLTAFDRLRVEFAGVAETEETVLSGTVVETDGELATVETAVGRVRAIIPTTTPDVYLSIRTDAVTLHASETTPESDGTSARNRFHGEVVTIDRGESVARVGVAIGADTELAALVTRTSLTKLGLAPGDEVVASFKATATRAFPASGLSIDAAPDSSD